MRAIRGLLALVLVPFMLMVPAATAEAHSSMLANEFCALPVEEMDMIFLRLHPTNYARIEKKMVPGECGITVTGHCTDGWCPVVNRQFDGWMHKEQLIPMSAAVYCADNVGHGWNLDLYEGPSKSTRVVASVHGGYCGISLTPFTNGPWVRIKAAGEYGWVHSSNLR